MMMSKMIRSWRYICIFFKNAFRNQAVHHSDSSTSHFIQMNSLQALCKQISMFDPKLLFQIVHTVDLKIASKP